MRLATSQDRWWSVATDGSGRDVTELLGVPADTKSWSAWCVRLADGIEMPGSFASGTAQLDPVTLDAPVVAPSKVIGLLGNDIERADSSSPSDAVDFFVKAPSSIIGASQPVRLPDPALVGAAPRVVPECELAVVIGCGGSNIAPESALEHVLGYTVGIDVTLRGPGERSRRKSLPTFCPLGPTLVTADEIVDPDDLAIRLHVGDELVQDWSTARMVRSVADAVSWVSGWLPLVAGDVILCGAPSMSVTLRAGDRLRAEIDRIGVLSIRVAE